MKDEKKKPDGPIKRVPPVKPKPLNDQIPTTPPPSPPPPQDGDPV